MVHIKLSREEIKARAKQMADKFSEDRFDVAELSSVKIFKTLHPIACNLEELGYSCITDARNIVSIIDHFKLDTSKMPIPDGDYKKFRQMVLAGEYNMISDLDLEETPEMTNAIEKALASGRTHITY